MLTYKQAYDKIIEAYFKDAIRPYDSSFCFCGTLCNNKDNWRKDKYKGIFKNDTHNNFMDYAGKEYAEMEKALLLVLYKYKEEEYEDKLFSGMCAALEVLKQIHKDRGENVDEEIPFTKRQLNKTPC